MDTRQITATLNRIFNDKGHRIVFWHDPEREFLMALPLLLLENVHILRLDERSSLETKIRLEREDPTGRYFTYSASEEPDYEDDWLLDIRLYSRSFRADRASIILDELGLGYQQHLRQRRQMHAVMPRRH